MGVELRELGVESLFAISRNCKIALKKTCKNLLVFHADHKYVYFSSEYEDLYSPVPLKLGVVNITHFAQ